LSFVIVQSDDAAMMITVTEHDMLEHGFQGQASEPRFLPLALSRRLHQAAHLQLMSGALVDA
jgi:hypothetical protein